jgi:hypothetical protein
LWAWQCYLRETISIARMTRLSIDSEMEVESGATTLEMRMSI